jgi:membrane protein DedA with SNARE-associated domain/rhodanese-related sulfurtransferase
MLGSTAALTGSWGLSVVFVYVLLAQAGLPLPAAPVLLLGGAVAVRDPVWGAQAFVLATAASTVADVGWYLAGRVYGNRILRLLCQVSLSPDSCVNDTLTRFGRWGQKAIVLAKFIPGAATLAPPLAGALRMDARTYLGLTLLGSSLWTAAYLTLGALAAPAILRLLPVVARQGRAALVLALLLLAAYILFKWIERRRLIAALRGARLEAAELRAMMLGGNAPVVLDVRSHTAFAVDPRTIPTAVHVPPNEVKARLVGVAREGEVVVYCNCPNEATAARIAKLLIDQGFTRVRPLRGGLDGWVRAGFPVERIAVATVVAPSALVPTL